MIKYKNFFTKIYINLQNHLNRLITLQLFFSFNFNILNDM